jgi:protein TonB
MSTFLKNIGSHLPFNKSERIIIAIVLLLHLLPALDLLHWSAPPPKLDETRVMANLVSPDTAGQQAPAAPPPKPKQEPKQEPKKKVQEKPSEKPAAAQTQTNPANTSQQQKSDSQPQSAAVAPASSGGASGTPIQTDIGKLVVVFQPDADAYYPSFSKRSGEQGTAVVRLIIDETGSVEDVSLLQSSNFPRLDRAASEIGKRYRFKPFMVNGSPQRISTNLLIKFNLKN